MHTSGLLALDLVLRPHEDVAALPSVVRAIRRFADVPLLLKLKRAMTTPDSITTMEQILAVHSEDVRLDALVSREYSCSCCRIDRDEDTGDWQELLVHDNVVNQIFLYGAQHASDLVVDWALATCPDIRVNGALWLAVRKGQLAAVQMLHARVIDFGDRSYSEDSLLSMAIHSGHLGTVEWLYNHYRGPARAPFLRSASENAARAGDLAMLQWIHAHCGEREWSRCTLEKAATHGQQHVMTWIYEVHADVDVELAMEAVAMRKLVDALVWLHERYPESRLSLSTMEQMTATSYQAHIAARLVASFPERYSSVEVGLIA